MSAAQVSEPPTDGFPDQFAIFKPFLIIDMVVAIVSMSMGMMMVSPANETTLSFISKLVGVFVTLIAAGPWMLTILFYYMRQVFSSIPSMVN